MKTFKFAGSSRGEDGIVKLRTFNDRKRIAQYGEWNHTEINLHELPISMTKEAAAQFLFGKGLISANLVPGAKKAKTVKITVPNRAIAQLTGAKITVTPDEEDQPLSAKEARKLRKAFCERVRIAYEAN